MNKILILLVIVTYIGFSCNKEEEPAPLPFLEQLSIDSTAIENYFIANNITNIIKDCSTGEITTAPQCNGYVSYIIHEKGDGIFPLATDIIEVSYKGRLLDTGVEFDANDTIDFRLSGLIAGWQIVLLEMQEGDSVTMYIPSGFGYGALGSGDNIPKNANLIFDMKLHTVNP